jgi:hypothetical protein
MPALVHRRKRRGVRFNLDVENLTLALVGPVLIMLARKGLRFDTLSKLRLVLECAPGDILGYDWDETD